MKTTASLFSIVLFFFLISCEGPQGSIGDPGQDGQDGLDAETGVIFEVSGDFTSENEYQLYYAFEDYNVTVYDGDAVLAYILWGQEETTDGGTIDVWRLLPQTIIYNEGIVQYNYDFTTADVKIFLDGSVSEYLSSETDNQVFRIAVIPASLLSTKNKSIDITDFNSVMKSMNKDLNSIKKIEN